MEAVSDVVKSSNDFPKCPKVVGNAQNKYHDGIADGGCLVHSHPILRTERVSSGGDMGEVVKVSVAGTVTVSASGNTRISIPESKSLAILVILSMSPGMRRSRSWLKMLLWDSFDEVRASNNLRQALTTLRRRLADYSSILSADRSHVWLENTCVDRSWHGAGEPVFYEDAPSSFGEEFEDWLRSERSAFCTTKQSSDIARVPFGHSYVTDFALPKLLLKFDDALLSESQDPAILGICRSAVVEALIGSQYFSVTDSSQLDGPNVLLLPNTLRPEGYELTCTISQAGNETKISLVLAERASSQILNALSNTLPTNSLTEEIKEIEVFAVNSCDVIHRCIQGISTKDYQPQLLVMSGIQGLMSLSPEGVRTGLELFRANSDELPPAMALGWQAFGTMLLTGERLVEDKRELVDETEALLAHALEHDSACGTTSAIAAHFEAFQNRDMDLAAEYLEQAKFLSKLSPFVWDTVAVHALYIDDLRTASEAVDRASQLGRFSPFSTYFEATRVMVATLEGRHDKAIMLGRHLLRKKQGFLPVLRHLVASYALSDRLDDAERLIAQTRKRDPAFGTGDMLAPDYPLPSNRSREMIGEALRLIGVPGFGRPVRTSTK